MAQDTLHVGQDSGGDKRRECVGDEVTAEEESIAGSQFAASVPLRQNKQGTGQESSLDKAQEESNNNQVLEVICNARQC
jgi:hypothetical protein